MMETRDSCMITIDAVGTRDPHMVFLEICVVASFIGESFRWNTAHFDYVKGPTAANYDLNTCICGMPPALGMYALRNKPTLSKLVYSLSYEIISLVPFIPLTHSI